LIAESKVFNHKYDGTNMGWAFEHMPYVTGIRDQGGVNYLTMPGSSSNYWVFTNNASTVALKITGTSGAGTWLYSSGSDYGLLNAGGSWGLRWDNANAYW